MLSDLFQNLLIIITLTGGLSDQFAFPMILMGNMLRPCPMLENPEYLRRMVKQSGAESTDLQSPESVDHLCDKCKLYAENWEKTANELWYENERQTKS